MNWLTYHKNLLQLAKTIGTLTPSQITARDTVLNAVKVWENRINLWGAPGTGKTFLAHYLHHQVGFAYFSDPTRCDAQLPQDSVVVIDSAPYTRQEARRLYDRIRWGKRDYTGPMNVILITRKPINDAVCQIELPLTDADITCIEQLVRQQFGKCNFESISQYAQQRSGLWWYVKTLAQRRD